MKAHNAATLVVFGATGDLFTKKIVPSLYRLYREKRLLSDFQVIGVGRQVLSDSEFQIRISEVLIKRGVSKRDAKSFAEAFTYHHGHFDDKKAYQELQQALHERKRTHGGHGVVLIYLAIPPELFGGVIKNLKRYVLNRRMIGLVRLLIEKPLGHDTRGAVALQKLLRSSFRESEIYRIDHYFAKQVLSALPTLRAKNASLKKLLTPEYVESVSVRLLESVGVEHRGPFYESVGALRDVGQNHLPLMLALSLMPLPSKTSALPASRARFLSHLPHLSKSDVAQKTIRAQYRGYRTIDGVHRKSAVETYFKISAQFADGPYKGVPFVLESSKRMGSALKEVVITLKDGRTMHIELEPAMRVAIVGGKKATTLLKFKEEKGHSQYTSEYAELMSDALRGDQTRFLSHAEVLLLWRFIDPIIAGWKKGTPELLYYEPETRTLKQ